jgi:hypothetical protein
MQAVQLYKSIATKLCYHYLQDTKKLTEKYGVSNTGCFKLMERGITRLENMSIGYKNKILYFCFIGGVKIEKRR